MTLDDTAWHAWRSRGIGGSDVPAILGLSSFGSPFTVWADKRGLLMPTPETRRQRIGKRFEAPLAAEFHDETGLYVAGEQTWCADSRHPHRRCTVDGFVVLDEDRPEPIAPWECKTDGRPRLWETADGVPPSIKAQAVWNAGVTGNAGTWLTVMHAGFRIEHIHIPFDPDDYAFMCERVDEFWTQHVLTGTPPEIDGSPATEHALAALWPDHDPGKHAPLDDLVDLITDRAELRDERDHITGRLAEIDNRLRAALEDAEVGTVAGVEMFTYRQQAGRRTTCKHCGVTDQGDPFRVLRTKTTNTNKERHAA
jgi:putative phage-type endonuclease